MAKKVKGKIVNKKPSTVWPKIKEFLRTLWSNDANMKYAVSHKWYWAVLIGLISLVITLVAPVVNAFNVQGSSYISGATSDPYYYGLYEYYQEADSFKVEFQDGKLVTKSTFESYPDYTLEKDPTVPIVKPYYSYVRQELHVLDIYVTDGVHDDVTYLNSILGGNPNYGEATTEKRKTLETEKYVRSSSFIFFSSDKIYSRLYSGKQSVSSISGNYNHVKEGFKNLNSTYTFKDVLGNELSTTETSNLTIHTSILKNYKTYADKVYIDVRNEQGLVTMGIYAGINAGIILLMGFVIWLMCRGKNNPNRSLKIWHGWQISAFQALTPSILALIIGFIMAQFASMAFVLVYSFRVMYLSMKYLRPAPADTGRK